MPDIMQTTPHGEYRLLQEGVIGCCSLIIISTGSRCTVLILRAATKRLCDRQFLVGALAASHFRHHLLMCRHLPDGGKLS